MCVNWVIFCVSTVSESVPFYAIASFAHRDTQPFMSMLTSLSRLCYFFSQKGPFQGNLEEEYIEAIIRLRKRLVSLKGPKGLTQFDVDYMDG